MARNSAHSSTVRAFFRISFSCSCLGTQRNIPGVALYMTSLTQLRTAMARSPYFATVRKDVDGKHTSVLPKLTFQGNLLSGATARVAVGFLLNPMSVLKARFEVCLLSLTCV